MARIRTIKPEFWTDEKLAQACRDARLLFAALLNIAEDHGVARANPAFVKSQAFPYDDLTVQQVSAWIVELERLDLIRRFGHDGQAYLYVVNFKKHQRIDRPTKPTLPDPPPEVEFKGDPNVDPDARGLDEGSTNPRRGLDEGSLLEGKGKEGSGKEGKVEGSPPPAVPFIYEPPTKPEAEWEGFDFWTWGQCRRQASGLLAEKPPRPEKLSRWWSAARLVASVERLQEAFYRYGEDKFWEAKTPPHPWAGFQSTWEKYVPQEAA